MKIEKSLLPTFLFWMMSRYTWFDLRGRYTVIEESMNRCARITKVPSLS